jgi:hypothetical protein
MMPRLEAPSRERQNGASNMSVSRRALARIVLAVSVSACARGDGATDSAAARVALSDTTAAASPAAPKAACPSTGQWAACSVFDRLDHAGLAPRRDSSAGPVRLDPLTATGSRLLLGGAELDVFVYPNEAARARDEERLDKHQFVEVTGEPTLRGEPTLIRSANLLAVLRSRNDHQRERVADALSAGPPQAAGRVQLPPSRIPQ